MQSGGSREPCVCGPARLCNRQTVHNWALCIMAECERCADQITRRKPDIQRTPETVIWTASRTTGYGRLLRYTKGRLREAKFQWQLADAKLGGFSECCVPYVKISIRARSGNSQVPKSAVPKESLLMRRMLITCVSIANIRTRLKHSLGT